MRPYYSDSNNAIIRNTESFTENSKNENLFFPFSLISINFNVRLICTDSHIYFPFKHLLMLEHDLNGASSFIYTQTCTNRNTFYHLYSTHIIFFFDEMKKKIEDEKTSFVLKDVISFNRKLKRNENFMCRYTLKSNF